MRANVEGLARHLWNQRQKHNLDAYKPFYNIEAWEDQTENIKELYRQVATDAFAYIETVDFIDYFKKALDT